MNFFFKVVDILSCPKNEHDRYCGFGDMVDKISQNGGWINYRSRGYLEKYNTLSNDFWYVEEE